MINVQLTVQAAKSSVSMTLEGAADCKTPRWQGGGGGGEREGGGGGEGGRGKSGGGVNL